jgi:DNA-binding XRE family transcriptional regulator
MVFKNMENKNHIREARLARGLSIPEAATLIGVEYQTYYYWDTGKTSPKKKDIPRVKKVFGLTTDQVLGLV